MHVKIIFYGSFVYIHAKITVQSASSKCQIKLKLKRCRKKAKSLTFWDVFFLLRHIVMYSCSITQVVLSALLRLKGSLKLEDIQKSF